MFARAAVLMGVILLAGCAKTESPTSPTSQATQPREYVRLTTPMGEIVLELDREHAPISVENFLSYVERGEYDGTIFHRVIEDFVVQAGGFTPGFQERPSEAPIKNEWGNGLKNVRGSLAMARDSDPDTATREFYINCVDNPKLDTARPNTGNAGYAVFGRVVEGMDVIDAIRKLPTTTQPDPRNPNNVAEPWTDVPTVPPVIIKAERRSGMKPRQ